MTDDEREMLDAIAGMVLQFCVSGNGPIDTYGLSAVEDALGVLQKYDLVRYHKHVRPKNWWLREFPPTSYSPPTGWYLVDDWMERLNPTNKDL